MADLYSKASLIFTSNAFRTSLASAIKPTNGAGDFSFSRSTASGSRIKSDGTIGFVGIDVPRLNYSTTSSSPSFLLERQRTNILTYSNTFNGADWGSVETTVTASSIISPEGILNGWKLNETTANNTHTRRESSVNVTSGIRYVVSAYVKSAERTQCAIQSNLTGGGFLYTKFNLAGTGSIYSTATGYSASITQVTGGWFRISTSAISNATTGKYFSFDLVSGSTYTETYAGASNTTGIHIYGAQIEAMPYTTSTTASSYIPTTTAAATSNADILSKTGLQAAGFCTNIWTVFLDYNVDASSAPSIGAEFLYTLNASNVLLWYLVKTPTGIRGYDEKNSTDIFTDITSANASKIALTSDGTTIKIYINGTDTGTSYTPADPSTLIIDKIFLEAEDTSILVNPTLSTSIKNLIIYPTELSSVECKFLTSLNT